MSGGSNQNVGLVDDEGTVVPPTGIVGEYQITDKDDDTDTKYYGFVQADGSWYIMRETTGTGDQLYRYFAGTSDYTTNWTNRAALSYDYFYSIF